MRRVRRIAVLVVASLVLGCTSEDASRRTLDAAGFSAVKVGGHALFWCGRDDWSATKFTATNPRGEQVSGAVCCGLLKACTVRF